jgi:hypothetical protein
MAERLRVLIERDQGRLDGIRLDVLNTSEVPRGGWGWYLPEAIRLNGRLAEIQGDKIAAEGFYSSALQAAQSQPSAFWELRVVNDLVQLWGPDKKESRGRALLEGVCSRISCRNPTNDLIRAQSLIDAL